MRITASRCRRHVASILLTACVLTVVTRASMPAAAAVSSDAPAVGSAADAANGPPDRAAEVGAFYTDGDDVHVSSTPPATASAHGWWVEVSGPGTTATVTVRLQNLDYFGHWDTVATSSKVVKSGGGRGNRATARRACATAAQSQWQSTIDVDIVGVDDSPERAVSPERSLRCSA